MRIFFYTLALISLFACLCEDTPVPCCKSCVDVIISDALPVQLWVNGCETYNEAETCGIHHFCFCQPWNCDDEIKFQFQDNRNLDFYLQVLNNQDSVVYQQLFDRSAGPFGLKNTTFDSDLSHWSLISKSSDQFVDWGWASPGRAETAVNRTGTTIYNSKILKQSITFIQGYDYYFSADITRGGNPGTLTLEFYAVLFNNNDVVSEALVQSYTSNGSGSVSYTLSSTELLNVNGIGFRFKLIAPGSGSNLLFMTMDNVSLTTNASVYETYSSSIIPSQTSPDVCDGKFYFRLLSQEYPLLYDYHFNIPEQAFTGMTNEGVSPNGRGWTQTQDADKAEWTYNGSSVFTRISPTFGFNDSQTLYQEFGPITGTGSLRLKGTYSDMNYSAPVTFSIIIKVFAGATLITTYNHDLVSDGSSPDSGSYDVTFTGLNLVDADRVEVILDLITAPPVVWGCTVTFDILSLYIPDYTPARSDCMDIRNNHECTTLIKYSNTRNFAGIDYANQSPGFQFHIRVPAIFFHERFPQDRDVIDLYDRSVQINGTVKAQKKLETDHMPYFMHRKMKLILAHGNISIGNRLWIAQEDYEVNEGENKRFPKRSASIWLTERNYLQRNVL